MLVWTMEHGAGSVVHTNDGRVLVLIAKDKWDKSKDIVDNIIERHRFLAV